VSLYNFGNGSLGTGKDIWVDKMTKWLYVANTVGFLGGVGYKLISTYSPYRFFYSGSRSFAAANYFAKNSGWLKINMTKTGSTLSWIQKKATNWFAKTNIEKYIDLPWKLASARFAFGADKAKTFLKPPFRPNNTWLKVEKPILKFRDVKVDIK